MQHFCSYSPPVFTTMLSVSPIKRESIIYHNLRSDEQLQVYHKYIIAFSFAYRYKLNLNTLKLCSFSGLLCVLIFRHGWVIVHLQTWLPARLNRFLLLIFLAALAAFAAAAAAVFATKA